MNEAFEKEYDFLSRLLVAVRHERRTKELNPLPDDIPTGEGNDAGVPVRVHRLGHNLDVIA